jgi:hypothetical protein
MIKMIKAKRLSLVVIGILLFIPLLRFSNGQESYVGIKSGDKYGWVLSVYTGNWNRYYADDLESTLENLVPLGPSNLSKVFNDWNKLTPPQSYWTLSVTSIGFEKTGQLLSPNDNTTITSSQINGTFEWKVPQDGNDKWDEIWYLVNDSSNFLRQTLNLTRAYSPYAMFSVLFAPKTISWSSLVIDFSTQMNNLGGWYKNVSAITKTNGFSLNIPTLGFENNSEAIKIDISYDIEGVLSLYEFSYGGLTLVNFERGIYIPESEKVPFEYMFIFLGLTVALLVEIILYLYVRKGRETR